MRSRYNEASITRSADGGKLVFAFTFALIALALLVLASLTLPLPFVRAHVAGIRIMMVVAIRGRDRIVTT